MPALPLRSCLIAAVLLAPSVAGALDTVRIPEPPPATAGQPLDLGPREVPPKPAKLHETRRVKIGRKGPGGRSALTDPVLPTALPTTDRLPGAAFDDTRHAPAAALPDTVPVRGPQELVAGRDAPPGSAQPAPEERAVAGDTKPATGTTAKPAGSAAPLRGPAVAESPAHPAPLPAAPVQPVTIASAPPPGPAEPASAPATRPAPQTDTQQYCSNIAGAAADARFAWQRKQITDLEAELKGRIAELDAKQEEVKAVLARRDTLMKKAADTVVALYAGMKPDAAAEQIAALDDDMAASVLAQLPQRKASLILNEIPADKAAKLVAAIATVNPPGKKT